MPSDPLAIYLPQLVIDVGLLFESPGYFSPLPVSL